MNDHREEISVIVCVILIVFALAYEFWTATAGGR